MEKSYLVSGAGSGIGRATAVALAKGGGRLFLLGRNEKKLEETRKQLEVPERHKLIVADLRDRAQAARALRTARLEGANLCGVVANAGVGGENHYGEGDRWDEILATNLTGTYVLLQEALPALLASKAEFRHIVVVSSILARLGVPGYSAYCASKAGLLGLVRSLAAEHAKNRVLINAVLPGWVETDMAAQGISAMADATGRSCDLVRDEQLRMVPLRKMAQPYEVATLIDYLFSERQVSMTGQALDINNGALMP